MPEPPRGARLLAGAAIVVACLHASPAAAAAPHLVPVVSGLNRPVFAAAAPSGRADRLYVVEQGGLIRIADGGRVLPKPFLDIRPLVRSTGLEGLFSLAFDPHYAVTHRCFVNYVGKDGNIYVTEFRTAFGLAVPASKRVLLVVQSRHRAVDGHYGGEVAFGPDGRLYASFGDTDDGAASQDPTTLLGKLVSIDVDRPAEPPQVVAFGLRNPWRFSFDLPTGAIYIGDVGESLREEVDRVPRELRGNANFGWDVYEGTVARKPVPADLPGTLEPPFLEYAHTGHRCWAVIGGYVYRGSAIPSLRGRYLYGDLCGGIWSVGAAGAHASDRRREPFDTRGTLVSFARGAGGTLYLVAQQPGEIYRVG